MVDKFKKAIAFSIITTLHSPSKCLAWVKKCSHVWIDLNFDPSLLTNKLWLVFMGMKQKKIKMADSKKQRFSKSPILNIFLWKFYGSVLGLVDWCEGQQCGSTYMAMRLFDISSKTGKKCNFCVFRPFYNFRPYIVTWLYFFVNILGV